METSNALIVTDGAGTLAVRALPIPRPGPLDLLVETSHAGINMVDNYWRHGWRGYSKPPPFQLGMEGAGTVVATGSAVTRFRVGDRVAGVMHRGSFARYWCLPAARAVQMPDGLSFETLAGRLLQGLTAEFLTSSTYRVGSGTIALVLAAGSGAGACTAARASAKGALVIGTASTPEKRDRAMAAGCDHVILGYDRGFAGAVRDATAGMGVDVVYDSVGARTFMESLDCLKPLGTMVAYGQASGPIPPIDIQLLREKGSIMLARPSLTDHLRQRDHFDALASALFDSIEALPIRIEAVTSLATTGAFLDRMLSRQSWGKGIVALDGTVA